MDEIALIEFSISNMAFANHKKSLLSGLRLMVKTVSTV